MKKQSVKQRPQWRVAKGRSVRNAAAWVLAVLMPGCSAPALYGQSLGQQVSPQPYTGGGVGVQQGGMQTPAGSGISGAQAPVTQYPAIQVPGMQTPGTGPGSMSGQQQLGTGYDIPQASVTTQISVGDLLDVVVFDTPDLSGRFRVNNQGNIILPLVGDLHVEGLTAPEVAQAVTDLYRNRQVLLHPQVTVFVAEFSTRGVTLSGEVRTPGIYQLPGPRNLTDMLAAAGGLNDSASKTVSIVHRSDPGKIITVKLNVGAQTPGSIEAANIQIRPGDTIFVARSGIVYVVGDLARPGGYQVEHNDRLSLLDAVALAGGPTQTSKLWDARLIRRSPMGREEMKIDLKKILYGGGPDMLMADGDILYVPISQRRIYTQQAIQAIIGAATAFGIYKESQL